jgi:ADP-ribosylglycohydrolase
MVDGPRRLDQKGRRIVAANYRDGTSKKCSEPSLAALFGSVHEFQAPKHSDFPLFTEGSRYTDDSVLTVAVAHCLLTGCNYVDKFHEYAHAYPDRCYGRGFWHWVTSGSPQPYNSWGNGSAMRVSPVGFAFQTLEEVLNHARVSAEDREAVWLRFEPKHSGNSADLFVQ